MLPILIKIGFVKKRFSYVWQKSPNPIYTLNFILTKLKYDIRLALRRFNGLQIKVTNKYIIWNLLIQNCNILENSLKRESNKEAFVMHFT